MVGSVEAVCKEKAWEFSAVASGGGVRSRLVPRSPTGFVAQAHPNAPGWITTLATGASEVDHGAAGSFLAAAGRTLPHAAHVVPQPSARPFHGVLPAAAKPAPQPLPTRKGGCDAGSR